MLLSHLTSWQVMYAFFTGQYQVHKQKVDLLKSSFHTIPTHQNVVLNLVAYNIFMPLFNAMCGFSPDHQKFVIAWSVLPSLIMGLAYYYYLYGKSAFAISGATILHFINNWLQMSSISLVCMSQMAIWHFLCLLAEPLLPAALQGTISFPLHLLESSLQIVIMLLYGLGAVLLVATPVWVYAYSLNIKMLGRSGHISPSEVVMEVLYTTSQCGTFLQMQTAFAVLQIRAGFPFHVVHLVSEVAQGLFANQAALLKFAWVHQLVHEIRPLHALVHVEHHICKGIYPNTPGLGLWEPFLLGGSVFQSNVMSAIPFLVFQILYCGVNIVIHTMWPAPALLQWHTSHHVVHADIYAGNVPSAYDERFSSDISKYKSSLEKVSPFIRVGWVSDAFAFGLIAVNALALHYVGGMGLGHVWHERM